MDPNNDIPTVLLFNTAKLSDVEKTPSFVIRGSGSFSAKCNSNNTFISTISCNPINNMTYGNNNGIDYIAIRADYQLRMYGTPDFGASNNNNISNNIFSTSNINKTISYDNTIYSIIDLNKILLMSGKTMGYNNLASFKVWKISEPEPTLIAS